MAKAANTRMLSLLVAIVMLLVSVYLFSSLVRPAFVDIRDIRTELKVKEDYLEAQEQARTSLNNLKAEYEDAAGIQSLLATALPRGVDLPQSVHQVQSLVGTSGLDLRSMAAEFDDGKTLRTANQNKSLIKEVKEMKLIFQTAGSYESLKRFLSAMEANIKIMDVVELDTIAIGGGVLVSDFIVNLYYQE